MSESRLLVPLRPDGEKRPLFIVPSAGSTPLSLVKLARSLEPSRPVYSFVFTGMNTGEAPQTNMDDLASTFLTEIRAVQPSGPYVLAGHCFGGTIAFDITGKLEAQGEEVALLILLETFVSPSAIEAEDRRETDDQLTASLIAAETKKLAETTIEQLGAQLSRLPPEHADRFTRITHHHLEMAVSYRPTPIRSPIVLFRSATYHKVAFESWNQYTEKTFSDQVVPGDTYSMLSPPYVAVIAEAIENAMSAQ